MLRRATSFLGVLLLLALAPRAEAQVQDVTIRQVHQIPQANLDLLMQAGASLASEAVDSLVRSPFAGDTIRFTAVVLSDPAKSGLSSANGGFPSRIHYFLRDTTANAQGKAGMDIQVVDGDYRNTGSLDLLRGDVVTVTAVATYFGETLQLTPLTLEVKGSYSDLGLPATILDPVVVTTADLNQNVGPTQVQANWQNFVNLNHQYVRLENATVWRSPNRREDRPNWAVTTDGAQTILQIDDISLRYRNDRAGAYDPNFFDVRPATSRFEAPPAGARVNLEGFVLLRGSFDPFGIGAPPDGMFRIAPWSDEHLEITANPTVTRITVTRPDTLVPGADPITVNTEVEANAADIAAVTLRYMSSSTGQAVSVPMTLVSGTTYTGAIPALEHGTFVDYYVVVRDVNGTEFESTPRAGYRVLVGGIRDIEHVQRTASGSTGSSPFRNTTTAMDLTATVQTAPGLSGFLTVQDSVQADGRAAPWSGLFVQVNEAIQALDLQPGDRVRITRGTVGEIRGDVDFNRNGDITVLRNVTLERIGTGEPIAPVTLETGVLQDAAIAEAHEGMLLRFENVTIVNPRPNNFGEWLFSSDGTADAQVTADDVSADISSTYAAETFQAGQQVSFIQGIWSQAFGSYRLLPRSRADIGEVTTAVEAEDLPTGYALRQNYPNPFNPNTTIEFEVGRTGRVTLEVFDLLGRRVALLVDGEVAAGTHQVAFEAGRLASGMYLYRLTAGTSVLTRSMTLLK